jgi:hypothetical protein
MAGVEAYDGNNRVYFDALRGLQAGWGDPTKMADAIWPLLKDWNKPFYRWGKGNPALLASGIEQSLELLNGFRHRTIDTLVATDEPSIKVLFSALTRATGRTNKKGFQSSPVGATKALHLLCPYFSPVWDEAISDHYGCERITLGFANFCGIMRELAAEVQPYLPIPDDRSVLKRIDEFHYSTIKKRRRVS